MEIAKKCRVEVKKDHLSKVATGSPESALSEIVWNALDADATRVDIRFHDGALGWTTIVVSDNGDGFPYDQAESLFTSLGGSWKIGKQKTTKGRFLHGRDGEGRFKAFILGRVVEWSVVYPSASGLHSYSIEGLSESLDEFTISKDQETSLNSTGVTVTISELYDRIQGLTEEKIRERLVTMFALYLRNYPDVSLVVNGIRILPDEEIKRVHHVALPPITENDISYPLDLDIIEWNHGNEKELWFSNENGFPLEKYVRQIRGTGDFSYTSYLRSSYFEVQASSGLLSVPQMMPNLARASDQAVRAIKDYFLLRSIEGAREQLDQWKRELIYPYPDDPVTPIEVAERQVFDIVAININRNLPDFDHSNRKSKAFQLRMLRQAIEKSPEELQLIFTEVLQLPKAAQEQLAELLKDASLSAIISASRMVTDRLKFLAGLEQLVFEKHSKQHLRERTQLHRILADNSWFFGHSFSLSVDDRSLTEVLRKHLALTGSSLVVDDPVTRLDDTKGIVDLMFSRSIPRNRENELEHLVVELKRPSVMIGREAIFQIKDYAYAVAADERFRGLDTRWNFWLVSNDYDDFATMELKSDRTKSGVLQRIDDPDITIWLKTWSQLIQENRHRLEFVREKLNYNVNRDDALAYLKKTYAEYTRGVFPTDTASAGDDNSTTGSTATLSSLDIPTH